MTRKTEIAIAAGLAALVVIGFATEASAVWVEKSDSWCRKKGFTPPCEVWEITARDPRVGTTPGAPLPKAGAIRKILPAGPTTKTGR